VVESDIFLPRGGVEERLRLAENRLAENRVAKNRFAENRLAENRFAEKRLAEKRLAGPGWSPKKTGAWMASQIP
jgi:hypothetical protein